MRGQSSFEFIILLGFMFIVFFAFFIIINNRVAEQHQINSRNEYKQLADMVEKEFVLASSVTNGYSRIFELPKTLNGESYNISLEKGDTQLADTLIVKGESDNQYIRFLSVKVFINNSLSGPCSSSGDSLLCPGLPYIIITKDKQGILRVRKDCVNESNMAPDCPSVTFP